MKTNIKNIIRFIGTTLTAGVTTLVIMTFFVMPEEIAEILLSKPIIGLFGLTLGATLGFIAGVMWAVARATKELDKLRTANKSLKAKLEKHLKNAPANAAAAQNLAKFQESMLHDQKVAMVTAVFDGLNPPAPKAAHDENDLQETPAVAES
jgi:gas vesicle protein